MSKKRILIVEDEGIVAEDIKRILQNLGYSISAIVSSSKEAIKKAEKDNPDLVLMDIVLKGKMNGIKAAAQIYTRFNIPVVYLTAYADEKTLEHAKIAEPYGYLVKPFSARKLHSTIEIALHKSQMEKRINHLNAVLRAIRNINLIITREKNRDRLLKGICNNLIETRGYHGALITLMDGSGKLIRIAEAGLEKDRFPMVELLKHSELPECGKRALLQPGVLAIKDLFACCTNCSISEKCCWPGMLIARLESNEKIYGLLCIFVSDNFVIDKEEILLFKEVAGDVAFALHSIGIDEKRKQAEEELKQSYQKLQQVMENIIYAIAKIVEIRDPYTAGHQRHVAQLARAIANEMELSREQINTIHMAAVIHDIGKIYIPAEILSKPMSLSEAEFNIVRTHPQVGYDVLNTIEFPWPIAQIVLQHHERMDGSGYPHCLCGDKILLEARILGVADVVEAMCSHRPYRPALGKDKALAEISQHRGILYDPDVVNACLRLFKKRGFKFD